MALQTFSNWMATSDESNVLSLKIDSMEQLPNDWDGDGAKAPSAVARKNAKLAVSLLGHGGIFPTRVAPSVEGGVAFTWREAQRDAVIEFYNDGEIVAVTSDRKSFPNTWLVAIEDLSDTLERLVQFAHA